MERKLFVYSVLKTFSWKYIHQKSSASVGEKYSIINPFLCLYVSVILRHRWKGVARYLVLTSMIPVPPLLNSCVASMFSFSYPLLQMPELSQTSLPCSQDFPLCLLILIWKPANPIPETLTRKIPNKRIKIDKSREMPLVFVTVSERETVQ